MAHKVEIREIKPLGETVFQYEVEKPEGFEFRPGQATEVSIAKDGMEDEKRPFTFTSLPSWDHLQFTIKSYPDHDGVTRKLMELRAGDHLLIRDPWGTIEYKGKGVFIAGGAGMTPFLSILRDLQSRNALAGHTLFFANKRERDIFDKEELEAMQGLDVQHVLSKEDKRPYLHGRIDKAFLKDHVEDFSQKFYVCGPDEMVKDVNAALKSLGADPDGLVFEE
jgi:ferredoxin-NADP reductase